MRERKNKKEQELEKPGQQLLKIREEKGLAVEVIADQLRLDRKLIHALENDDYEPFPATTYVRGYIRAYAKALGVESTALVKAFDQHAGDEPLLAPFVSRPEPQVKSNDKHMQLVTYAVIAVLLISLVIWWQNWRADLEPVATVEQENTLQPDSFPAKDASSEQNYPMPNYQAENALTEDGQQSLPSLTLTDKNSGKQPSDFEHEYGVITFSEVTIVPGFENSEAPAMVEEQSADLAFTPLPEEDQQLPDIATFEADQQKGSGVFIELKDVSWIQITDAKDIRSYSGLAKADEKISVSGEPPFRIIIGKTEAISKITYAAREIDLKPLSRGDVARFFVDNSGAYR